MTRPIRASAVVAGTAEPTDTIELDYDHRHRRRMTMTTCSGLSFLLDLPSPTVLRDGDCLQLENGATVKVIAKRERVADIHADSPRHLAELAWHLGNRHLPTQILDDRLRILNDHVIVGMVQGLGATVEITDAPFQPQRGAYAHADDHEH